MNQSNTERVMKLVVTPLQEIFGNYTDGMVKLIIEDVANYSDHVLKEGIAKLRRHSKFQPKIAHIIEACNEVLPAPQTTKAKADESFHCRGHAETLHPQQAREILMSLEGQEALRLGVVIDLLTEYEKTGRKKFSMEFVGKCHHWLGEAAKALSESLALENPDARAFEGLFNAMREREKKLFEKYYQNKLAA